jgi:hypothetical protein
MPREGLQAEGCRRRPVQAPLSPQRGGIVRLLVVRMVVRPTYPLMSQFSIATDLRGASLVERDHTAEPFASADADGRGRISGREGDDVVVSQFSSAADCVVLLRVRRRTHDLHADRRAVEGSDAARAGMLGRRLLVPGWQRGGLLARRLGCRFLGRHVVPATGLVRGRIVQESAPNKT